MCCEYGFELAALSLVECGASCNAVKTVTTLAKHGNRWVPTSTSHTPCDPEGWLRASPDTKALRAARERCRQLLAYSRQRANCTAGQLELADRAEAVAANSCQDGAGDAEVDSVMHHSIVQSLEADRLA